MYDYNNLQDMGKGHVEDLIREADRERRVKRPNNRKPVEKALSILRNLGK